MRKFLLSFLLLAMLQLNVFADTQVKDYQYYQNQILGQRLPYSVAGLGNSITTGRSDVVTMFMKAGMSPNETFMGMPMTLYAINNKQPEILDILLINHADAEATAVGLPILFYAIKHKSSDCVAVLIKNNVDINRSFKGLTPLNFAIVNKQSKIVEQLLTAGARPNEQSVKLISKTKDEYMKETVLNYVKPGLWYRKQQIRFLLPDVFINVRLYYIFITVQRPKPLFLDHL